MLDSHHTKTIHLSSGCLPHPCWLMISWRWFDLFGVVIHYGNIPFLGNPDSRERCRGGFCCRCIVLVGHLPLLGGQETCRCSHAAPDTSCWSYFRKTWLCFNMEGDLKPRFQWFHVQNFNVWTFHPFLHAKASCSTFASATLGQIWEISTQYKM